MAQLQMPNSLKRILVISLVFIFISSLIVIVIGYAFLGINTDIKKLNKFLKDAENSQPNFEKSLEMYTDKTKEVIQFLLALRPDSEEKYVEFISKVEEIGQNLSLEINLKSIKDTEKTEKKKTTAEKTIAYTVSFYGTLENLKDFLKKIETLPYFVEVKEIKYRDPSLVEAISNDENNKENQMNVNLKIALYTK